MGADILELYLQELVGSLPIGQLKIWPWPDKNKYHYLFHSILYYYFMFYIRGRRGRSRMVVEFTTTCAISGNQH